MKALSSALLVFFYFYYIKKDAPRILVLSSMPNMKDTTVSWSWRALHKAAFGWSTDYTNMETHTLKLLTGMK